MELSTKLKQRFCKDNGLSIQVFKEPFFSERLEMLGCMNKYNDFKNLIKIEFKCNEERYFEYYNQLKDRIIDYIKGSQAYNEMLQMDMNKCQCKYNIKQSDVYKVPNIGRKFISIDMVKANFSALVYFGLDNGLEFFDSFDYEKFIGKFTDIDYFADSKYIRQVVFGNCCSKRQVTYEKYLISRVLDIILDVIEIDIKDVYSMCSDEIILYADNITPEQELILNNIAYMVKFPIRVERFTLGVVTSAENDVDIHSSNTYAYVKKSGFRDYDLKCMEPVNLPFVLKAIEGKEITESDLVFFYNGKLAKFLEEPKLRIKY